jgi:hypothetical protein
VGAGGLGRGARRRQRRRVRPGRGGGPGGARRRALEQGGGSGGGGAAGAVTGRCAQRPDPPGQSCVPSTSHTKKTVASCGQAAWRARRGGGGACGGETPRSAARGEPSGRPAQLTATAPHSTDNNGASLKPAGLLRDGQHNEAAQEFSRALAYGHEDVASCHIMLAFCHAKSDDYACAAHLPCLPAIVVCVARHDFAALPSPRQALAPDVCR